MMVIVATMAQTDTNNPMSEIGIPVDAQSFNIYTLGEKAPQIQLIIPPDFGTGPNQVQKVCWLSFWCPDLPTDQVANAIYIFSVSFSNLVFQFVNGILYGGTIVILLIANFLTIFNFVSWGAFQGNLFLTLLAIALTALLGGSVMLWIYAKVTGAIPFVGSGG